MVCSLCVALRAFIAREKSELVMGFGTYTESGVSVRDQPYVTWFCRHVKCVRSFFCVEYRGSRLLRRLVTVYQTARRDMLQDNRVTINRRANISVFHFVIREYQRISFRFTRISAYLIPFCANTSLFQFVLREYQRI